MIKTILVAGLGKADNNIIRFCEDNWLETEHIPAADNGSDWNRPIPNCDAAIIATCYIGHGLQEKVRNAYAGKPLFFYNKGISEIKDGLLSAVYGPGNYQNLNNSMINEAEKFVFALCAAGKMGHTKHKRKVFCERVANLIRCHFDCVAGMFDSTADRGHLKARGNGRGQYFEILPEDLEGYAIALQQHGFFSLQPGSIFLTGSAPLAKTFVKPPPKIELLGSWIVGPDGVFSADEVEFVEEWEDEEEEPIDEEGEEEDMAGPKILKSIPPEAQSTEMMLIAEELIGQRDWLSRIEISIAEMRRQLLEQMRSSSTANSIAAHLGTLPHEELERMKKVIEAFIGKELKV